MLRIDRTGRPKVKWYTFTQKEPRLYQKIYVFAYGAVHKDERDVNCYFGPDRVHLQNYGFPDLAKDKITHWAEREELLLPEPPEITVGVVRLCDEALEGK